jgi:hypothetical protein
MNPGFLYLLFKLFGVDVPKGIDRLSVVDGAAHLV